MSRLHSVIVELFPSNCLTSQAHHCFVCETNIPSAKLASTPSSHFITVFACEEAKRGIVFACIRLCVRTTKAT